MKLNFRKYGEKDSSLIILHGLLGSLDNWHSLASKFSEHFTVYTLDQRNHGKSPHTKEMTYDLMAQDLFEFYDQQNLKKANLIGHSMGGKTAMTFALKYPELVEKLVVVDISPSVSSSSHFPIFNALFTLDLDEVKTRREADEKLAKQISEFAIRQFLLKNISRDQDGNYNWRMNLEGIASQYQHITSGVTGKGIFEKPTLFIKGERSDYISEEDERDIYSVFPNASLITIEDVGHWVHAEAPEKFYQVVTNFLG